ncbi:MAG: glycosyltransferase family 4 protein [Thermoanaerobaculales bacterium]|jgi:glycosyltransferase involved in cell wall biosynthesis|nr:glycosyltransferase family 4 protein [Thermoanaerobaculales bacterium]
MTAPLRIGIDLTCRLPLATGVDTYLEQLVVALGGEDRESRYTIWVNREDRTFFDGRLPEGFAVAARCLRPRPVRLLFQQLAMPALAIASRLDIVHSPSFIMPMLRGPQRHLLTVYDMTSFSRPECHEPLRRSRTYRAAIVASLRRAHLVSVPSRATRDRVLEHVPEVDGRRVRVVPPGLDGRFRPRPADEVAEVRARLGLTRPYVLYLGTLEPRKNLPRLVRAFARAVQATDRTEDLVLAGRPGWETAPLEEAIRSCGLADRVRRPGYVDAADLPALLTGAALFVYPSLEEGFGFPPLEAMACGVPTVAGDTTSLAENLRGAAELVEPTDVDALAAAMARLLADPGRRAELGRRGVERAARFSWRATAAATVGCYRELAGKIDTRSQPPPV